MECYLNEKTDGRFVMDIIDICQVLNTDNQIIQIFAWICIAAIIVGLKIGGDE